MKSTMTKTLLVTALATGLSVASTSAMTEAFPDLKAHESAAPGSVTNFLTADMSPSTPLDKSRLKFVISGLQCYPKNSEALFD